MTSRFAFSAFVFDAGTAELTRNGRPIHLPEQSARVLTLLLEQAGTLVKREDLENLLWPDGDFVDRDQAMNKAVYRLRTILRDDPKAPRYIETVPKRGYRFRSAVSLLPPTVPKFSTVLELPAEAGGAVLPCVEFTLPTEDSGTALETPLPASRTVDVSLTEIRQYSSIYSIRFSQKMRSTGPRVWLSALALVTAFAIGLGLAARHRALPVSTQFLGVEIQPLEVEGAGAGPLAESFRLDLIDSLAQSPGIRVRAAHLTVAQHHAGNESPQFPEALHVDVMLLGKFVLRDKDCVVQLELVKRSDATHLASFEYSGSEDQLPRILHKAQHDISVRLQFSNTPGQSAASVRE